MPQLPIADFLFQWRQQIKRDVRRLKLFRVGVGYVMQKRSQSRRARWDDWCSARDERTRVNPRQHARRDRFNVTFHSANLSSKIKRGDALSSEV